MHFKHITRLLAVAVTAFVPLFAGEASATSPSIIGPDDPGKGKLAWFEGEQIDLGKGWGPAKACALTETSLRCYRSEAQMDRALGLENADDVNDGPVSSLAGFASSALTTCSSSVRLYENGSYGGSVFSISIRWTYINLGGYGFDNRASSYRVGACDAQFYAGSSGGGGSYPGGTWAFASSSSMCCGWDNVVTSIYIL
jgi:hypothetical protein